MTEPSDSDVLSKFRAEMDRIDDTIVEALNRRIDLVRKMKSFKAAAGIPFKDAEREREIFKRVLSRCDPAERDMAYGVYERIFSGSRGVIEAIARGVCVREGKVLLCRAKDAATTYLPGGHIEFGESGREALVREIKEETGRGSKAGRFLGVVENSFSQKGKMHSEINLVYAMEIDGDRIESAEEWIGFEWCGLSELNSANLLPVEMIGLCNGTDL